MVWEFVKGNRMTEETIGLTEPTEKIGNIKESKKELYERLLKAQKAVNRLEKQRAILEGKLIKWEYEAWERGKEIVFFDKLYLAHAETLPESFTTAISEVMDKFNARCIK